MTVATMAAPNHRTAMWAGVVVVVGLLIAAATVTHEPMVLLLGGGAAAFAFTAAAAAVDARTGRLPNVLLAPAAALLGTSLPLHALLTGEPARLGQGILGAAVAGSLYFVAYAVKATGAGDVKLATIVAFHSTYISWTGGAIALIAPYLLALPAVIFFLARGQKNRRLPFGPYLAAGYAVALIVTTLTP